MMMMNAMTGAAPFMLGNQLPPTQSNMGLINLLNSASSASTEVNQFTEAASSHPSWGAMQYTQANTPNSGIQNMASFSPGVAQFASIAPGNAQAGFMPNTEIATSTGTAVDASGTQAAASAPPNMELMMAFMELFVGVMQVAMSEDKPVEGLQPPSAAAPETTPAPSNSPPAEACAKPAMW
jgi:hypothetical protein